MKYFGNYSVNGTTMIEPFFSENLKELVRDLKGTAIGNMPAGTQSGKIWVSDCKTGIVLAEYRVFRNGVIRSID